MKTILAFETSCDETAAAIATNIDGRIEIVSNITASSAVLQAKYGGVIPEQAAREQLKAIIPVLEECIQTAGLTKKDIDAIAVTQGPGLIGSLLIGVETAKALSLVWDKPLIPVNHLLGHFYGNWINEGEKEIPTFPFVGLLVSGGHSDIVLFKDHSIFEYLGGTRDDAAGECFDKCARLMGLPGVQGGPVVGKLALEGNPKAFHLPRPLSDSSDLDYSFSGLKTAVMNLVKELEIKGRVVSSDLQLLADLCASLQEAIVDTLIKKVIRAAQQRGIEQIVVAGGVAANSRLKEKLSERFHGSVIFPQPKYCTDNAAMIAAAGFFMEAKAPLLVEANPNLSLS